MLCDNEEILKGVESPPILFLIFNRPLLTHKVFNIIRGAKPSKLFIAADGPRKNNERDDALCKEVRSIVNNVDWKCDVKTLFREENLGCRVAITSAIDWFFNYTDAGIILEDDCLPSESFFGFCALILEKYKHDEKIMQINGNFHLHKVKDFTDSYYFSKLNGCWGWATWKRAWKEFDSNMDGYADCKDSGCLLQYYESQGISDWMESYLDEANMQTCGIWSTQWSYAILKNNGLCINPTANLVNNIGFIDSPTSGLHESFQAYSDFPLDSISRMVHPKNITYDNHNDKLEFDTIITKADPRLLQKTFGYYFKKIITKSLSLFH